MNNRRLCTVVLLFICLLLSGSLNSVAALDSEFNLKPEWISVKGWVWLTLVVTLIGFVLILALILWRNRSLKKQVKEKTEELEKGLSDRKQAEESLRLSEENFRLLFESSPLGTYIASPDGTILDANQSLLTLLGSQSVNDTRQINVLKYPPLVESGYAKKFSECVETGQITTIELSYKSKWSREAVISNYIVPLKDKNGEVVRVYTIMENVTHRKQAEKALQKSEQRYRDLFEKSKDAVLIIENQKFVNCNQATVEMLGYSSKHDLLQTHPSELSPLKQPDGRNSDIKANEMMDLALKTGSHRFEWNHVRANGEVFPAEILLTTISNEKSKQIIHTVWRDITERKKAETELRESNEKYKTLVDRSPLGIAVIDRNHTYTYLSAKFTEIFGYTLDDFSTGKKWFELAYPDKEYRADVIKRWIDDKNRAQTGESRPQTFDVVCKNGNIKTIDFKPIALETGEQLIMYEDITERKKSEELMIQTEKMMSVGGLAAGMAHELNNPLGGMLQGVQNINRRLSPDLKSNLEPAKEFGIDLHNLQLYIEKRGIKSSIKGILNSGKRASQIISSMLLFSRKSESRLSPSNLTELVENALELAGKDYDLKKKYDFRSIKVIREFNSDLPLVSCIETEIEQVVLNLLKNAAYAMAKDNQKDPHHIIIRLLQDRNMVRLEIEDNGPGLDEVVKKRVFEPFFTTKPVGEGTGLGLSVSYMIITNNHNGTMELESEPGKGTRFIIRLPFD